MHSKIARLALAATFLVSLSPTVTSTAGPSADLEDLEDRLNKIRNEVEAGESRADYLKDRIDSLNEDITTLQIAINKLDAKIADIESEVRTAQAGIDRKQVQIDAVEADAKAQAVALYKVGGTEVLDTLLDSTSLAELDERVELLGVAADENTGALVKFHRLQLEIQSEYDELFRKKRQLTEVRDQQAEAHSLQSERRTLLAADLDELETELGHLKHKEGELETAALRLTGDIQSAQAREAVSGLGESAQGFIWPLNGGVTSYYGERWGRMHTGIDIDGYTGQPIVASKAGRVIMATYYSGYGNTVVVDHGDGYATLYAHMSDFRTNEGAFVEQGEIVGYVGCTGSCTGDHLHFEVRVNGNPVDPMKYLP
jgi:murein DD-endopeptidase MepM/ murein hydrolase activator NlpD